MATHMGQSVSQLAVSAGMAPSTLTRFLGDLSNSVSITQTKLEQIARYTGFRPHQFPGRARAGLAEPDAVAYANDNGEPETPWMTAAIDAARQGRNGVEAWVMKSAALDGAGIMPGDIVIIDQNLRPKPGDVVVAQIVDYQRGTAETVMRLWQPPFITMHSFRMGPQRPEQVDEERVSISGTMIGVLRRPR